MPNSGSHFQNRTRREPRSASLARNLTGKFGKRLPRFVCPARRPFPTLSMPPGMRHFGTLRLPVLRCQIQSPPIARSSPRYQRAGVPAPNYRLTLICISVGIEGLGDLIADSKQTLALNVPLARYLGRQCHADSRIFRSLPGSACGDLPATTMWEYGSHHSFPIEQLDSRAGGIDQASTISQANGT